MDFRILGPLEVVGLGGPAELGTVKVRALLRALLLRANREVDVDVLADELWPDRLPADPRAALHTNVARLRRALGGQGAADRLETAPGAYRLRVEPGELDAERFEAQVRRGEAALQAGQPSVAAAELREALRLWRGPVLADGVDSPHARAAAARLEGLRLDATEARIDAELALGRHREVTLELETLTTAYPLRERLWAQLVVALYRSDRQADALDRCHRLRTRLAEDLGVDPSPGLRALEHRILVQDHTLLEPLDGRSPERTSSHHAGPTGPGADSPLPLPRFVTKARRGPFVGRAAELRAIERAGGRHGAIAVVVGGEPGIGKSRLAAEAAAEAHRCGTAVVAGRCDERPLVALHPFVEVVDAVVDARGADLFDALGPLAAQLGRVVPDLHIRYPDAPAPGDAEVSDYLVARAVAATLRHARRGAPLLLVVDDLQWADDPTVALLRHLLLEEPDPTCVVATIRTDVTAPDAVRDLIDTLARVDALVPITLSGLDEAEVGALVAAVAPGGTTPWVGRSIHAHTGGNPFFAVQLARHLAERDPTLTGRAADVPGEVVAVVERRLDALGPHARAALEVAALAGTEFDLDLVATACPDPGARAGLDAAQAAGLVVAASERPGRGTFTHAIVREVLDRGIEAGRRGAVHRAFAEALERRGGDGLVPHAQLAHHWCESGAGGADRAVAHATEAATEAMQRRAHEDALQACRTGLRALDGAVSGDIDRRRLPLLLIASRAQWLTGSHGDARTTALAAADLARAVDDTRSLAESALAALRTESDPSLVPLLEDALGRLRPEDDDLRAPLLVHLGWALAGIDPARADAAIERSRPLVAAGGDIRAWHRLLTYEFQYAQGIPPEERAQASRSLLERLGPGGPVEIQLDARSYLGTALLEAGDLEGALSEFVAYARVAGELRVPGYLAVALTNRAMLEILAGRLAEGEGLVHEAMLQQSEDPTWLAIYGGQLVAIRLLMHRYDEAVALLDADVEHAAWPVLRATRAAALARGGRAGEAVPIYEGLLADGLHRLRRDMFWATTLAEVSDAAVALGDRDGAAQVFDLLLPDVDRFVVFAYGAVCWGSAARFLAPLAALLDRHDDALALFERSTAAHERVRAGPFLVLDRLGCARSLLQRGRSRDQVRARRLIEDARGLSERLGLPLPHDIESLHNAAGVA